MVYQELVNYVRYARGMGYGDNDIKKALLDEGWQESDIKDGFDAANLLRANRGMPPAGGREAVKTPTLTEVQIEPLGAKGGVSIAVPEGSAVIVSKTGAAATPKVESPSMVDEDEQAAKFSLPKSYFSTITRPTATLTRARYHAGWLGAFSGFSLPLLVQGVIVLVCTTLAIGIFSSALPLAPVMASNNAGVIFGGVILYCIMTVLSALVFNGIVYGISRFMGGSGSFMQQFFLTSITWVSSYLFLLGCLVLSFLIMVAGPNQQVDLAGTSMPLAAIPAVLLITIASLYSIAINVIAVREAHKFSTFRAFVALAVPVLLLVLALVGMGMAFASIYNIPFQAFIGQTPLPITTSS